MVRKIFSVIDNSNKLIHFIAIMASLIIYIFFIQFKIELTEDKYSTLMTTLGIMTTFFFITVENVKYELVLKFVKLKKIFSIGALQFVEFPEGHLIKNTIFTLAIMNTIIIFVIFITFIFGLTIDFLLFLSVIYLSLGFLYTIVLWHISSAN